jgi:hypothetical protein
MLELEQIKRDRADRVAYWYERGVYANFSYADALRAQLPLNADIPLIFHSRQRPQQTTVGELAADADHVASAYYHWLGLRPGLALAAFQPRVHMP